MHKRYYRYIYWGIVIILFIQNIKPYNKAHFERLLKGEKNLQGTILEKAIIEKVPRDVDLNDANLENALFREVKFQGLKFNDHTKFKGTVFLKCSGLSKTTRRKIRQKGGYISDFSIICNSDIHYPERKEKKIQLAIMKKIAKNPKNKVKAVIIAGDMVQRGEEGYWKKFKSKFYNPLAKNVLNRRIFMCIGNHDRWRKSRPAIIEWLFKKRSPASKAIEKMYHGKYYKRFLGGNVATDIVSLGECPAFNNYKSAKWYSKKKEWGSPSIVFFHYTPLDMVEWWTTHKKPLEMDELKRKENKTKKRRESHKYSDSSIETRETCQILKNGKHKVMLFVVGHLHETYYKDWCNAPLICTGGMHTFAVAYFDRQQQKCIAIEVINSKNSKKNKIILPYDKDKLKRTKSIVFDS